MSIDLQNAFEHDMTFTDESGTVNYVQADDVIDSPTAEEKEETTEEADAESQSDVQSALFGK